MMTIRYAAGALLLAVAVACGGGEPPESERVAVAANSAPAAPTAADRDHAEITANWPEALRASCGRALHDALGTRDLVQGALDGVQDPQNRAAAEIEDAKHWIDLGNAKLAEVRPVLEAGTCDGAELTALEEAVQFYVKAGTSAVQASQIVKS